MTPFLAEHYPAGLGPDSPLGEARTAGGFPFARREHSPESLASLAEALRERAARLRKVPFQAVLDALAGLHRDWAGEASAARAEAVARLHAATGYPAPVLDRSLRGLFRMLGAPEMLAWFSHAGVAPAWLDEQTSWSGLLTPSNRLAFLAHGPALTVVVASGNLPGAALPSVIQSLLLKSPCLVKTGSQEPVLLPLYARALAERAPEAAAALAVTGWQGGRADLEAALLARAEALIAYGGSEALAGLRTHLPVHARFLGYGHRISFSAVGREYLTRSAAPESARSAAVDLCLFDQQGCLSPQAVYVEEGGEVPPERFAELLAAALAALETEIPRRPLSAAEAAAIHQYRASVEMRGFGDPGFRLWSSPEGTAWTVALEPGPELRPCCLNRTAVVRPIASLEELPGVLAPTRHLLISAGLAVGPRRRLKLAQALAAVGVTRITGLGHAQDPATVLHHDGINAVAALARFAVVERSRNRPEVRGEGDGRGTG